MLLPSLSLSHRALNDSFPGKYFLLFHCYHCAQTLINLRGEECNCVPAFFSSVPCISSSGHDIGISSYSDFQAPAELPYLNTLLPGAGLASLMIIKQNPVTEPGPVVAYCGHWMMLCCC